MKSRSDRERERERRVYWGSASMDIERLREWERQTERQRETVRGRGMEGETETDRQHGQTDRERETDKQKQRKRKWIGQPLYRSKNTYIDSRSEKFCNVEPAFSILQRNNLNRGAKRYLHLCVRGITFYLGEGSQFEFKQKKRHHKRWNTNRALKPCKYVSRG